MNITELLEQFVEHIGTKRPGFTIDDDIAEAEQLFNQYIKKQGAKAEIALLKGLREYAQTHNSVQTTTKMWQILEQLEREQNDPPTTH